MNWARLPNGQIVARDQERGLIRDQHYRREIGREIVERIFVERLVDGVGAAAENELVAVRRRLRHARGADHSSGAADVLDDHLLAQNLGEASAEDASEHIGAPAGREWDHHGERPHRPILRGGRVIAGNDAAEQQHRISRTHGSAPFDRRGNSALALSRWHSRNRRNQPHRAPVRAAMRWQNLHAASELSRRYVASRSHSKAM